MGACFALVYGIKPNALPQEVRRLPLGSGLTVTCTIPLPILNTTTPPPAPPQILPGIRKQQGEPGICGGCLVRGRLSPPLSLHASRGRWCHPGTQQKRGPRVVLAVEEVGVLAPKQPVQEWRWPACSPAGFTVPHPALPGGCSVAIIWPQGQVTPKPASSLCLS